MRISDCEIVNGVRQWKNIPRGVTAHIGKDVWRSVCHYCDYHIDHSGGYAHHNGMGTHEVVEHNAVVPGINGRML